ncbi:MAG: pyridoxamine 5'-phosphate oxidase family protein [Alphaproteobacteria bacterium]|nr:pyridoxamine 5'-phosphate oxidase family protein [Alphaproteobacteria bacterium]MDX5416187.1 pyridoxamine 5'-phosphate oxidase family protein [Alphaproteobacteria bacterium]MDX5493497.1 pyridoxamine 5'-phosphate oxidase family protein [Alphaproteobacteria bacterium]
MSDYRTSRPYRVKQVAKRAAYDRETVHAILDAGYLAHIGFMTEAGPVALPTFYVRDGESVLFHGSRKARFMRLLAAGAPMCFTVTHVDGLVLARSAFHHSMNYRSVMAHGSAEVLNGAEKDRAMALFTARVREGRPGGERPANAQEAKATEVLRLPLAEVAAKVRTGGPIDDAEDMGLPVWAGVIPMQMTFGEPVRDIAAIPAE